MKEPKRFMVVCRSCGNIFSDIIKPEYLENFPVTSDDWLRQLDRECQCCNHPDYVYEGVYYEE